MAADRSSLLQQVAVLGMALLATACSSSVVVQADFPQPVIEPVPLTIGLRYLPEFTGYEYAEELPNDFDWRFDIGAANRALFDTVFGQMFEHSVALDATAPVPPGVDLVVVPTVDALEFSLPRQSGDDQYAVWIRYRLEVQKPDGDLVTEWPIAAYGQADARRFGRAASMTAATRRAMRDAAAQIAAGLADKAQIESILADGGADAAAAEIAKANRQAEPAAEEAPASDETSDEDDNDAS